MYYIQRPHLYRNWSAFRNFWASTESGSIYSPNIRIEDFTDLRILRLRIAAELGVALRIKGRGGALSKYVGASV